MTWRPYDDDATVLRDLAATGGVRGAVAEDPPDRCSLTPELRGRLQSIADRIEALELRCLRADPLLEFVE